MKALSLITALLLIFARSAMADEQLYDGQLWDVSYRGTGFDSVVGVMNFPSCQVTSKLWADRKIVLTYSLTDSDHGIFAVTLFKNSWKLTAPKDPSRLPLVTMLTGRAVVKSPMVVQSPSALMTGTPTSAAFSLDLDSLSADKQQGGELFGLSMSLLMLQGSLFDEKQPDALLITFTGNEQPWGVPAISRLDAAYITKAISDCQIMLTNVAS